MGTRRIRQASRALVALALVLLPIAARAEVRDVSLKDLVARSDLIVVAEVTQVEVGPPKIQPDDESDRPLKVATARVIETWKGTAGGEVRYIASPTWVCDTAWAEKGERVVLFLAKRSRLGVLRIAHAGQGRMPLRDVGKDRYATLGEGLNLPKGTPTISETKTGRMPFTSEAGKPAPAPWTFTSTVRSIELRTLRDLVRSAVRPKSGATPSDPTGRNPPPRPST